jgi:CRISPR-associated protein Csx16
MTTYFITRHPGALEWAERQGIHIDQRLEHLDPEQIRPGDRVLGTLPANLAAAVCARGGEYYHLALDMPADARGRELSADDLENYGARLQRYHIEAMPEQP